MIRDLTICLHCGKDFVYPVEWYEVGKTDWHVLTRCGNCGTWKVGNYDQETVDVFDTKLEVGIDVIGVELRRMERQSMAGEIDDFVEGLAIDAILPEDF